MRAASFCTSSAEIVIKAPLIHALVIFNSIEPDKSRKTESERTHDASSQRFKVFACMLVCRDQACMLHASFLGDFHASSVLIKPVISEHAATALYETGIDDVA
eukprot:2094230-Pleurochrysis_carterae.AAC.1